MTPKLVSYLPGLAAAAGGFACCLAIAGLLGAIAGSMVAYAAYRLVGDSRSRQGLGRPVPAVIVCGVFVALALGEFDLPYSLGFITGEVAIGCGAAIALWERSRRNARQPDVRKAEEDHLA
jgi:membrane associated rhomboid family serine protease